MTIIVNKTEEISAGLTRSNPGTETPSGMFEHSAVHRTLLAQQVSDPDILGQIKNGWDNFVETGQIWALIIGIVLGYLFRGFRGT